MADEIQLSLKLAVRKSSLIHSESPGTITATLTGNVATGGVQTITTTAAVLSMSSVTTAGYGYFRNIDGTNSVELGTGTTTFVAFAKLKAGEAAIMRLGTNAPSAKAGAATVGLQYYILQD